MFYRHLIYRILNIASYLNCIKFMAENILQIARMGNSLKIFYEIRLFFWIYWKINFLFSYINLELIIFKNEVWMYVWYNFTHKM